MATATDWVPMTLQLIFGIGGNVLALVLLIRTSGQHKWHSFYRLFTGLVISDLSIGILASPVTIAAYVNSSTKMSSSVCGYDSFVLMFGLWSSALVIGALTVDRLLVMRWISMPQNLNRKKYVSVLVVCWMIAGIFSLIHLPLHETHQFSSQTWCYMNYANITSDKTGRTLAYFYSIFGLTFVSSITLLNACMFFIVTASSQFRARLTDTERVPGGYDFHSNVFLATVTVLFSVLWIPHLVLVLQHASKDRKTDNDYDLLCIRLALTNSIINPWLYVLLRKENIILYKSFIDLCRHRRNKKLREVTPLLNDEH